MKVLKLIDEKLEEIFLVIILIAAVVIVAMQVVTRYVFKIPLPWSEEIARYLFLADLGGGFLCHQGKKTRKH